MIAGPTLEDRFFAGYFRRKGRGFHRLMRWRGKTTVRCRIRYGALFDLAPLDYIDAIALRDGYYESEVMEALRPFLTADSVFWDVGANIGLHAITAARLSPLTRVVAFEPNPAVASRLRSHAELNAAPVEVQPLALGDRDGDATLQLGPPGNAGMSSLVPRKGDASVRVRIARADTLIDSGALPAPNVVKLDIEGAESLALRGFGQHLAAPSLRAVIFESDPRVADFPGHCPAASLLAASHFTLQRLERRESSAHLLANFLAVRS